MVGEPQCLRCKHLDRRFKGVGWKCKAYPKTKIDWKNGVIEGGIPDEIYYNKVDHTKSYKGDHGIQFEPMD